MQDFVCYDEEFISSDLRVVFNPIENYASLTITDDDGRYLKVQFDSAKRLRKLAGALNKAAMAIEDMDRHARRAAP